MNNATNLIHDLVELPHEIVQLVFEYSYDPVQLERIINCVDYRKYDTDARRDDYDSKIIIACVNLVKLYPKFRIAYYENFDMKCNEEVFTIFEYYCTASRVMPIRYIRIIDDMHWEDRRSSMYYLRHDGMQPYPMHVPDYAHNQRVLFDNYTSTLKWITRSVPFENQIYDDIYTPDFIYDIFNDECETKYECVIEYAINDADDKSEFTDEELARGRYLSDYSYEVLHFDSVNQLLPLTA